MKSGVWICVVLVSSMCFAQSDSLGDFARQQKSAAHARAKRVFTNENLPHASPAEASNGALIMPKTAAESQTSDKTAEAKANATQPTPSADTQKRIAELKDTEEAQQRAVKKFEEELKDDSISADRKQLFEDGLHNAQQLLEQATAERVKAEKALGGTDAGGSSAAPTDANTTAGNASTNADDAKPDASDKTAKPDDPAKAPAAGPSDAGSADAGDKSQPAPSSN